MQINEIKELAILMNSEGLSDIELKIPGMEIKLKKSGNTVLTTTIPSSESCSIESFNQEKIENNLEVKPQRSINCKEIKSPIVGTFYGSASPESPAYVKVGDTIKKGDILCIIEAMKMMNEIEAEFDGKIAEILSPNESAVEYGQTLFVIEGV